MAEIAPFRGLLYNQARVPDLDAVITPPYDVISPAEQEMYYRRHPYNMIRLILGKRHPRDDEHNNWYTRAAAKLQRWLKEGVLLRDPRAALYEYEVDYLEPPGRSKTRRGFICLVRLEDFSQGSVRPHERTYEATKSERLKLMCACGANLSQIFALYSDPAHEADYHLLRGRPESPVVAFTDSSGIRHRLWRLTSQEVIQGVRTAMTDKQLFIADGHHRYETALAYRRLMQQRYPGRGPRASFNYVLMYLSNMDHPGLTILPTHRVFVDIPQFRKESFLDGAGENFEVSRYPFDGGSYSRVLEEFLSALSAAAGQHPVGVYVAGTGEFLLLKLSADRREALLGHLPRALRQLDVVVLTELILKGILGVEDRVLNDEKQIQYCHSAWEAVARVEEGHYRATFLINPTRIEQVQEVATSGLIMPHKSTYFYPKVVNGSVLNLVDPHEDVPE